MQAIGPLWNISQPLSTLPSSPGGRHRCRARPGLGRDTLWPLLLVRGPALRILRRRANQLPGNLDDFHHEKCHKKNLKIDLKSSCSSNARYSTFASAAATSSGPSSVPTRLSLTRYVVYSHYRIMHQHRGQGKIVTLRNKLTLKPAIFYSKSDMHKSSNILPP